MRDTDWEAHLHHYAMHAFYFSVWIQAYTVLRHFSISAGQVDAFLHSVVRPALEACFLLPTMIHGGFY
jgi:hypothetical protein